MINLFEYQNKAKIQGSFGALEGLLDDIWNKRERSSFYSDEEKDTVESQRFLQFLHQSNEIRANKYVGVIHFGDKKINLLPKIFYDQNYEYSENGVAQIQNHVLWWLSYCRKIKFPKYQTSMGNAKSDFFEVLIYLFSKYTRELLSSTIYQQYQQVDRELSFIKGRLNTSTYISQNLSSGNWHKFNCQYDLFEIDNEFNRIIKYVSALLLDVTCNDENKQNLREILFILDEVSDERATAEQCSRISFNSMFGAFETVRDYCHLFLQNCVSLDYKNELKLFAFLLPMEYVFEDFIFGFIDKELEGVVAKAQRSDTYLDEDRIFNLRPDLWINSEGRGLIADTKYKIVYRDAVDPKKGISQNDLYQMLAYAVRFAVDEIVLFYPGTVKQQEMESGEFTIKDALANNKEVLVKAVQLPLINSEIFLAEVNGDCLLNNLFEPTKERLKTTIKKALSISAG